MIVEHATEFGTAADATFGRAHFCVAFSISNNRFSTCSSCRRRTLTSAISSWPVIARASLVEPDDEGRWWADLGPVQGPVLGPFTLRSFALEAEQKWLKDHWLANPDHGSQAGRGTV
jgi:hypothetical protein